VRSLPALALVLAACSGGDRSSRPAARVASTSAAAKGPDALVLRVPLGGGVARVSAYPSLDSDIWTGSDTLPALARALGFDADGGLVALMDSHDRPLWLDLRSGSVTVGSKKPVRGLVSVDGTNVFGIGSDGAVARFAPTGNWVRKLPGPAHAAFPQVVGSLVVLTGQGRDARLWRLRPPDNTIVDSTDVPDAESGTGAPLGDRICVTSGSALLSVSARTLAKGPLLQLDHPIRAVVVSPSGDRFYVLTDDSPDLHVVASPSDRVTARIELPGEGRAIRTDPLGRYILVRAAKGDSLWVVSVGTSRVIASLRSAWRGDLPFVAPDGEIAVAVGADVRFLDPLTPRQTRQVAGGARDFWFPFVWPGFRSRSAAVSQAAAAPGSDSVSVAPVRAESLPPESRPPGDTAKAEYTVSFAVLLDSAKAQAEAAKIVVDGTVAHVVTGVTGGTAVYRIVLGPYATREQAERVGRASGQTYYIYAGSP
jgi:hypothetical protein